MFVYKYNNNNNNDDNVKDSWYESKLFNVLRNTINYKRNDE